MTTPDQVIVGPTAGQEVTPKHPSPSHPTLSMRVREAITALRQRPGLVATVLGWLALLAFVWVTIVSGMVSGKTMLAVDMMGRAPVNWGIDEPEIGIPNILTGDTVDSVAPRSIDFAERMGRGDFPEWNPYVVGGEEFAGLPNLALLSPLSLPWLVLPAELAPGAVKLLEIVAIALGMSLFLRRLKLPAFTWPLATLAYASSGFMVVLATWPQTRVAALIPLAFWATERLIQERRWSAFWPLSLVIAAMWLGGFPAVTIHTLYTSCAYAAVRAIAASGGAWKQRLIQIGSDAARYALGIAGSIMLAFFTLLPFYINSKEVINFEARSYGGVNLPTEALATYIFPHILGTPNLINYDGGMNPVETMSYVGIAAVGCALVALGMHRRSAVSRPVLWFFVALALIGSAAVYLGGPLLDLIQMLPTMRTSLIGRFRGTIGFAVAVLAAIGVASAFANLSRQQSVQRVEASTTRARISDYVGWGGAIAIGVLLSLVVVDAYQNAPANDLNRRWVLESAALGTITVAAIGIMQWWRKPVVVKSVAVAAIAATIALPGAQVARAWWTQSNTKYFYPETSAIKMLANEIGNERFVAVGGAVPIGVSTAYEMRDLLGHAFMTQEWRDVIAAVDASAIITPTYAVFGPEDVEAVASNPVLDRFAVKYMVVPALTRLPGRLEQLSEIAGYAPLKAGESIHSATFAGPVRGVTLALDPDQKPLLGTGVQLEASLISPQGDVLAETHQTLKEVLAANYFSYDNPTFEIPFNADELPDSQEWQLEVRVVTPEATMQIGVVKPDELAVSTVRPVDDGLDIIHTSEVSIVERKNALPRIRWASEGLIADDTSLRIAHMNTGLVEPDQVVLHSEPVIGNATDYGSKAQLTVEDTVDKDITRIQVDADGPGWVVVADSMLRSGWKVSVDGEERSLMPVEHAGAAVFIEEAGAHTIEIKYEAPGLRPGLLVSGTAALAITAAAVFDLRTARRKRSAHQMPDKMASASAS